MKKSDMLYAISCGTHIKIGITSDIEKRLIALQTGNPHKLKIYRVLLGGNHNIRDIEKAIHEKMSHFKVEGEWFTSNNQFKLDLDKIINMLLEKHTLIDATDDFKRKTSGDRIFDPKSAAYDIMEMEI